MGERECHVTLSTAHPHISKHHVNERDLAILLTGNMYLIWTTRSHVWWQSSWPCALTYLQHVSSLGYNYVCTHVQCHNRTYSPLSVQSSIQVLKPGFPEKDNVTLSLSGMNPHTFARLWNSLSPVCTCLCSTMWSPKQFANLKPLASSTNRMRCDYELSF